MDCWARLSMYESTDIVRELFQARHGRELSAERAREIVSAIAQGREYFYSAADAGLLVRPLLQYYGVLSLSRGLILLLNKSQRENALPQGHGLTASSWGQILSANDRSAADLEISTVEGTFTRLLSSTENHDLAVVYTGPFPQRLMFFQSKNTGNVSNTKFTFRQVMARIPELREIYERSFEEIAANYRAFVFTLSHVTQSDIDVFAGRQGLPSLDQLRTELSIPAGTEVREATPHNFLPPALHYSYRILHPKGDGFPGSLPQIETGNDGEMSIITPFADGISISRIGRFFLLSFFLGTLARYHPTSWLSIMQGRQRGDRMLPIIRESMNIMQRLFPELIIGELEGR